MVCFLVMGLICTTYFNPILAGSLNNSIVPSQSADIVVDSSESEYFGVFVGLSAYEDDNISLPPPPYKKFSDERLRVLYDTLLEYDNWNEENMILLLNENGTKENIESAILQMSERVDENDVFVFAYQGHGGQIDDWDGDESINDPDDVFDEIICPHDFSFEDDVLYNYLSDDELDALFDTIDSQGMFLIFESCYSGGMIDNNTEYGSWGIIDVDQTNRVIVTATCEEMIALTNMFIDLSLMKSFSDAISLGGEIDADEDGFLSAEELSESALQLYKKYSISSNFNSNVMRVLYGIPMEIIFKIMDRLFMDKINSSGFECYEDMLISKTLNILENSTNQIKVFYASFFYQLYIMSMNKIGNYPTISDQYYGDLPLIVL